MKNNFQFFLLENEYTFDFVTPKLLKATLIDLGTFVFKVDIDGKVVLLEIENRLHDAIAFNKKLNDVNLNKFFIKCREKLNGRLFVFSPYTRNHPNWLHIIKEAMNFANNKPIVPIKYSKHLRQIDFSESINEARNLNNFALDVNKNKIYIGDRVIVAVDDDYHNSNKDYFLKETLIGDIGVVKNFYPDEHNPMFVGIEFDYPVISKKIEMSTIDSVKDFRYKFWAKASSVKKYTKSNSSKHLRQIDFSE